MENQINWETEIDVLENVEKILNRLNNLEENIKKIIIKQQKLEQETYDLKSNIKNILNNLKEKNYSSEKISTKQNLKTIKIDKRVNLLENRLKILEAIISELKLEEKHIEEEFKKKTDSIIEKTFIDIKKIIDEELKKINNINKKEIDRIKNIINSNLALIEKTIESEIINIRKTDEDVKNRLNKIQNYEKSIEKISMEKEKHMKILNTITQEIFDIKKEIKNLKNETNIYMKNIRNEIYNKIDDEISGLLSSIQIQKKEINGDKNAI